MRTAVKLVFLLLFVTSCVSMMSANVISNGTFAGCTGGTAVGQGGTDFSGSPVICPGGWTFTAAASGSSFGLQPFVGSTVGYASFGGDLNSYDQISQPVTTTAGTSYTIGFDLYNGWSTGDANFEVLWDGKVVDDISGTSAVGTTPFSVTTPGTSFSVIVTAGKTGSDTLAFQGYQQSSWYELSNVAGNANPNGAGNGNVPVPEPSMLALLVPALGFVGVLRRKLSR